MIRATSIVHSHDTPADVVTLNYDDRFRRRLAMVCEGGTEFLLDLPKVTELSHGDHLKLEDGRLIEVRAAPEPLMRATASGDLKLPRMAWHVGNRHLPCEILDEGLVLRYDHVIEAMLQEMGAKIERFNGPFTPEGGAYGQGRTHSHEH